MKNIFFVILLIFISAGCNNDDDDNSSRNTASVNQLPPATQTGAYTFGCLLDGEVFLPQGGINPLDCVYQYVDGGYYFGLQGNRRNSNGDLIRVGVVTNDLQVAEGETYILHANELGNASGGYLYNASINYTSQTHTGELTITRLDTENQIVSGTFWFDVQDNEGVVHEIRDGRFDMQYTQ